MDKSIAFIAIDERESTLENLSDRIFDAAEIGYKEYMSAEMLCAELVKEGFEVTKNAAGIKTAFIGRYGSGKPVVGILGEFDALSGSGQETAAAESSQKERTGNNHGCGHNLLGVGALAAVIAVKEYLKKTNSKGTIVYYGCPAEEGGSDKTFMAKAGLFGDLDCALTWHPCDYNAVGTGTTLANVQTKYRFFGISAHAASTPHLGRSALDALELMSIAANFLREHIIPEARLHYSILYAGGKSPNVVQPYAEVLYLVRAPEITQAKEITIRLNKIAEGAALMTETRVESVFTKACSNIIPNRPLKELLYNNMKAVPLPEYTEEDIFLAYT